MLMSLKNLRMAFEYILTAGHRARSLKELEGLDQATLNDLGMSRAELINRSHGKTAAKCAAF